MSTPPLEGHVELRFPKNGVPASNAGQEIVVRAWHLKDEGKAEAAWDLIRPLLAEFVPNPNLGLMFARLSGQFDQDSQALAYLNWLLQLTPMPQDRRAALHFAACTLLDRAGEYDAAFDHARRGKQAYRQPFDLQAYTSWIDAQINYFTAEKLAHLPRPTHGNRRPVFIIGMPRSGTSLVEQILACHPQIHAAGELPGLKNVRAAIPEKAAIEDRYPACLDAMGLRQANQLSAIYLQLIESIDPAARYVTDKMPTNFEFLGLIALLFRNCHVIHCKRGALDTCLSCYMTGLPSLPFTNDLAELGAFYRNYERFLAHFQAQIGVPAIEIQYESLVDDIEGETRRLLNALDLPWEERCLEFHKIPRVSDTASVDQVQRPIYKSSVARWRNYERHLGDLIAALGGKDVAS